VIILHGDNTLGSRQRLRELKGIFAKNPNTQVVGFKGNQLSLTQLIQATQGNSLFGLDQLVIIEKLFTGQASKNKQEIIDSLKKDCLENLIIWEDKQIDGRKIAPLKAKVEVFKIRSSLFNFLDAFRPQAQKEKTSLFHQTLNDSPVELIFFLLVKRVAQLIVAKDSQGKDLESIAPWQKKKILDQSNRFSLLQLLWLYRQLLLIESSQKTGRSKLGLDWQVDLLLSSF